MDVSEVRTNIKSTACSNSSPDSQQALLASMRGQQPAEPAAAPMADIATSSSAAPAGDEEPMAVDDTPAVRCCCFGGLGCTRACTRPFPGCGHADVLCEVCEAGVALLVDQMAPDGVGTEPEEGERAFSSSLGGARALGASWCPLCKENT